MWCYRNWNDKILEFLDFGLGHSISFGVLVTLTFILIVISLSCYQANIIQLGLDQLLEAPSEKLGLYIH